MASNIFASLHATKYLPQPQVSRDGLKGVFSMIIPRTSYTMKERMNSFKANHFVPCTENVNIHRVLKCTFPCSISENFCEPCILAYRCLCEGRHTVLCVM
jgi:hypothetical protein